MNPKTGWPVSHGQSISVVAPACLVAGSCATIAMLLEAEGESFLEAQQLSDLAIAGDGTVDGTAANSPVSGTRSAAPPTPGG